MFYVLLIQQTVHSITFNSNEYLYLLHWQPTIEQIVRKYISLTNCFFLTSLKLNRSVCRLPVNWFPRVGLINKYPCVFLFTCAAANCHQNTSLHSVIQSTPNPKDPDLLWFSSSRVVSKSFLESRYLQFTLWMVSMLFFELNR